MSIDLKLIGSIALTLTLTVCCCHAVLLPLEGSYLAGTHIDSEFINYGAVFRSGSYDYSVFSNYGPYDGQYIDNLTGAWWMVETPDGPYRDAKVYDYIVLEFVNPLDYSQKATTDFFSVKVLDISVMDISDPGYSPARLEAYDGQGNLIDFVQAVPAALGGEAIQTLTINAPGIAKLYFKPEGADYLDGYYAHNGWFDIQFDDLTPYTIPEPAGVVLFGCAFFTLFSVRPIKNQKKAA